MPVVQRRLICGHISIDFPGPISSILVNKYGSRPIMIAGGCLSGCGLIAASFCNTVEELYFCVGVVGGLGLAFNLNPALTMIGKYFFKKRPLANGLAMAGSPVFLSTLFVRGPAAPVPHQVAPAALAEAFAGPGGQER
nr:PREDICTED: monocarboxylate transporter 1-like [Struthio camelus australis]